MEGQSQSLHPWVAVTQNVTHRVDERPGSGGGALFRCGTAGFNRSGVEGLMLPHPGCWLRRPGCFPEFGVNALNFG